MGAKMRLLGSHLQSKILHKFTNFYRLVRQCRKPTVKILRATQSNNLCSTFGRNCQLIRDTYNVTNIADANQKLALYEVPAGEQWRTPMLKELLQIREGGGNVPGFEAHELQNIIDNICRH